MCLSQLQSCPMAASCIFTLQVATFPRGLGAFGGFFDSLIATLNINDLQSDQFQPHFFFFQIWSHEPVYDYFFVPCALTYQHCVTEESVHQTDQWQGPGRGCCTVEHKITCEKNRSVSLTNHSWLLVINRTQTSLSRGNVHCMTHPTDWTDTNEAHRTPQVSGLIITRRLWLLQSLWVFFLE